MSYQILFSLNSNIPTASPNKPIEYLKKTLQGKKQELGKKLLKIRLFSSTQTNSR